MVLLRIDIFIRKFVQKRIPVMRFFNLAALTAAVLLAVSVTGCTAKDDTDKEQSSAAETSAAASEASEASEKEDSTDAAESSEEQTSETDSSADESNISDSELFPEMIEDGCKYIINDTGDAILQGEYENGVFDTGRFTMELDENVWSTDIYFDNYYVRTGCFTYRDNENGSALMTISVRKKTTQEDNETALEMNHDEVMLEFAEQGCSTAHTEQITVDGEKAYLTRGTAAGESGELGLVYIDCVHDDLIITMTLSGDADSVTAAEQELIAAVAGFKFTDNNG